MKYLLMLLKQKTIAEQKFKERVKAMEKKFMGLAILNKNLNAFGKCETCGKEYNALNNVFIKGIAKINGKIFIIINCVCDSDVFLETDIDFDNDLPGCVGLKEPVEPNDCNSCSSFVLCKIMGLKNEW